MPYLPRSGYETKYGDLCNEKVVRNALEGITDVVLLAGLVGDPITKKYKKESKKINDDGIKTCINQLNGLGIKSFVFVEKWGEY